MREYIFRGKRKDNGEWVEGIPIQTHIGTFIVYEKNPHYCSQYGYMEISELVMVDPSTVGQFTGLMDKNGKRIFEGDVLEGNDFDADDGYGVVEWNDGAFEINNHYVSATFHENYWGKDFEIIGNIHDNPELSEGVV